MKFVIFGLTISSSWGNGHATLWRGLCKALIRRGHQVTFFEHDVPYYAQHRDFNELPGGELVLYTNWNELLPRGKRELANADVGMVTSYCADGIAASQLVLDSGAKLTTFYDLDTPVTLDALNSGKEVTYIGERGLRDFDLVLSYTGGVALGELEMRLGAKRVAPLYGHVDPEAHRPVATREDWRCDLSYLGTYAEDRQATLESLFIEPARRLADKKFLIGGAQYPAHFPWTENVFFVQHLPPADHPAFFCSGRLTLNATRRAMAQMGYCPSGRLFEAAACGCPLLSDTWPGLNTFFTPGKEILIANTPEDAMNALQLSDAELKQIAEAARERTLAEHTSEQRAMYLERVINDALAGSESPGLQLPDYSDTESSMPGAPAIREAGVEAIGANHLHRTHGKNQTHPGDRVMLNIVED
ncbi:MAG TPA: glycosyltransferase [Verrucomicrobiae bacterium]|jgi:spore maturation protein CgeB